MTEYDLIYADPPWRYDFSKSDSRKVENHYPTESVEAMVEAGCPAPIAKNAACYMWGTAPKLRECIALLEGWGFGYKTMPYVWHKVGRSGMGYYNRVDHEYILVGVRGKWSPPPPAERQTSVVAEKPTKHSAKPECFRDSLKRQYPSAKAIELFARWDGDDYWDVWGNEVREEVA